VCSPFIFYVKYRCRCIYIRGNKRAVCWCLFHFCLLFSLSLLTIRIKVNEGVPWKRTDAAPPTRSRTKKSEEEKGEKKRTALLFFCSFPFLFLSLLLPFLHVHIHTHVFMFLAHLFPSSWYGSLELYLSVCLVN
jgi:hypothetical protein